MALKYPDDWKFEGCPYEVPGEANGEFIDLVRLIAEGTNDPQTIFEDFKSAYGMESVSSSGSWAEHDLIGAMDRAKSNAARYISSFYSGMETVRDRNIAIPKVERLNKILATWNIPLVIEPPFLNVRDGDIRFEQAVSSAEPMAMSYVRGSLIGRGGFGAVYRVTRKTKVGEYQFAMKVLHPNAFIENTERAKARFIREMAVLGKLQHRGIVALIEAGLDGEQNPYFLMPFIEGANLQETLSGAQPVDVFQVFDEVLRALAFAHKKNAIHRDLKPSNVLIRAADFQPIMLDFGCSFLLDEVDESLTSQLIGTPGFIPEEVLMNPKHRDVRQDVFACGVMLYQVIMGKLPRPSDYEPIEDVLDGYAGIDGVIQAAIAPESKRTPTAEEMRLQLAQILQRHIR